MKKILPRSSYSTVVVRNFIYEEVAECTNNPGTGLFIYASRLGNTTTFSSYLGLPV
jgi:hypothetical protein